MIFQSEEKRQAFEDALGTNGIDYGSAVFVFAILWAGAMERDIAQGARIEQCADFCSREADMNLGRFGMTGFQYGCAVGLLADTWTYGEELRRWHNLKTQIGDEGERANEKGTVLNPALMTFTPKED